MDLYQHGQIKKAHQSVSQVAQEINYQRQAQRNEMQLLDERIDRLTLLCEAMWNVIVDQHELSEDDLVRSLVALDESDGTQDGRKNRAPIPCECGAMVNPRVGNCQFCGAPAPVRSSFDAV